MPGSSFALTYNERVRIFTAATPHGEFALEAILSFTEENLNIIHAINSTALDSILSSVASRVGSQQLYDRFVEVMTKILNADGITQTNFESHQISARGNLKWQSENAGPIEEFFENLSTTTTEESTTLSAGGVIISTILLIACLVLKHIL